MRRFGTAAVLSVLALSCLASVGLTAVTPTPTPFYIPTHTPTPSVAATATPTPGATGFCYSGGVCYPQAGPPCMNGTPWIPPGGQCPPGGGGTPTPTPIVTGTPTPVVTGTPTATPTPVAAITMRDLGCGPFQGTYCQWVWPLQLANGDFMLSYNGGHLPNESTVPRPYGSPGTGIGECLIITRVPADGSAPVQRTLDCSAWNTSGWEEGSFTLAEWFDGSIAGVYGRTHRIMPPGNRWRECRIGRLGMTAQHLANGGSPFDDPWPFFRDDYLTSAGPVLQFPLGLLLIGGEWHLYMSTVSVDTAGNWYAPRLQRWSLPTTGLIEGESWGPVNLGTVASGGGVSTMVLAPDGVNLLTIDQGEEEGLMVYSSADLGLTWKPTGEVIPVADGYAKVSDCHFAVGPGGVALDPKWVICVMEHSGDWSTKGQWELFVGSWPGANVPANLFTPWVTWTAPAKATP